MPQRLIAAILAFGSGVLISALSVGLMEHGCHTCGLAIGIGALLDGIPNRSHRPVMLGGRAASVVAVAAIFLSNIPEGLSSAAGMKQAGRSRGYVFGIWGGTAFASGVAALLGYAVFRHFPPDGGSDHGHRGRRGSANDRRHHDPGGLRRHARFCRFDHGGGLPDGVCSQKNWERSPPAKDAPCLGNASRGSNFLTAQFE